MATPESEDVARACEVEERKVVRKVDLILMPILTITLGLQVSTARLSETVLMLIYQFYDKAVLGNAGASNMLAKNVCANAKGKAHNADLQPSLVFYRIWT